MTAMIDPGITFDEIRRRLAGLGLAWRGAFHPQPADGVPALADGGPAGTLILLGWTGGAQWPAFAASPEAADGRPDPLDRWSRRVIGSLAEALGGQALFPFEGRPFLPFQRWAKRAEPVFETPLGLLIHPDWGLWHSYRGAVCLPGLLDLPPAEAAPSPCESCAAKPCLTACPVGAFAAGGYDVGACAAHLRSPAGADCRERGCLARRACPAGREHAPGADAAGFYMAAFLERRAKKS